MELKKLLPSIFFPVGEWLGAQMQGRDEVKHNKTVRKLVLMDFMHGVQNGIGCVYQSKGTTFQILGKPIFATVPEVSIFRQNISPMQL